MEQKQNIEDSENITIEHPINKPDSVPKVVLDVTLSWSPKNNARDEHEEIFFIKNVSILTFSDNLNLTNDDYIFPQGYWLLDGWLNRNQEYYLKLLYQFYGEHINHKLLDLDEYYYNLRVLEFWR